MIPVALVRSVSVFCELGRPGGDTGACHYSRYSKILCLIRNRASVNQQSESSLVAGFTILAPMLLI